MRVTILEIVVVVRKYVFNTIQSYETNLTGGFNDLFEVDRGETAQADLGQHRGVPSSYQAQACEHWGTWSGVG